MSSSRHKSSSSSTRHHKRRSSSRSDSDNDDRDDYYRYKDLYREAKNDLKRKRRQVEDSESKLREQSSETKKAKQDTQDLWKIYYTLQQELQQSYERNAKLNAEKSLLAAEIDALQKKLESLIFPSCLEKGGDCDPDKLKAALCAMQKQKLEMQNGYNEIVLENKKLKEKEGSYEPRLRELEKLKQKFNSALGDSKQISSELRAAKADFGRIGFSREEVEKYQRWNALLMMESQQKGQKLYRLDSLHKKSDECSNEILDLKQKLTEAQRQLNEQRIGEEVRKAALKETCANLTKSAKKLRMEVSWSGNALETDLDKFGQFLEEAKLKFGIILEKASTSRTVEDDQETTRL